MADVLMRDLDPELKRALQARARAHGRSLSDEAKALLRAAIADAAPERPAGTALVALFRDAGSVELDIPRDERPRVPPDFA